MTHQSKQITYLVKEYPKLTEEEQKEIQLTYYDELEQACKEAVQTEEFEKTGRVQIAEFKRHARYRGMSLMDLHYGPRNKSWSDPRQLPTGMTMRAMLHPKLEENDLRLTVTLEQDTCRVTMHDKRPRAAIERPPRHPKLEENDMGSLVTIERPLRALRQPKAPMPMQIGRASRFAVLAVEDE